MLNRRFLALLIGLSVGPTSPAFAQPAQLIFTAPTPDSAPSQITDRASSPVIEERGLALWSGSTSDFGVGTTMSTSHWTMRSVSSMTEHLTDGRERPGFQQLEIARSVWSHGSTTVAAGGGIRQQWDGSPVLLGRIVAGSDAGGGRLQGSLVLTRTASSHTIHEPTDVFTTIGWTRTAGRRLRAGVEAIGQDLEGLWNPAEADGGAKVLIGPSLAARSASGTWAASVTAGPVLRSAPNASGFAFLASASWIPSLHR
jgi:hypothetical protein